jgi:hypothetical protein
MVNVPERIVGALLLRNVRITAKLVEVLVHRAGNGPEV